MWYHYKLISIIYHLFHCSYKLRANDLAALGPIVERVTSSTGLTNGCELRRRYILTWEDTQMNLYEFIEPFPPENAVLSVAPLMSFTHSDVIEVTCARLYQGPNEFENTPYIMDASFCKHLFFM